jgi:4-amino-4-deoxy-L-arabinose transferase-like glycosyltransferase
MIQNYYQEIDGSNYPNKTLRFDWYQRQAFHVAFYLPFVQLFGVSKSIVYHESFFCVLSWVGVALIANMIYGKWEALIAVFFLASSLSWLIHVKDAGYQPMICACLMIWLVYFMVRHMKKESSFNALLMGFLLGLGYLSAWIGFAFMLIMTFLGFFLLWQFKGKHLVNLCVGFASIVILFPLLYSMAFNIPFLELHSAIYHAFFSRYTETSTPALQCGPIDKTIYLFKCLFWNSETIPYVFTLFLIVGLYYAKKDQFYHDLILLLWVLTVFGVLCSIYLFAHRYSLLVLPALAILAANGVVRLYERHKFKLTLILLLSITAFHTHYQYYHLFTEKRKPNYEVDRMRGHSETAQWLKKNFDPSNTLLVLGDSVNLNPMPYMFNCANNPFTFTMWTNHFDSESTSENVKAFEKHHRKIVYLFSTTILMNAHGKASNNWGAFAQAHNKQPDFIYSYRNRPLIIAYSIP